MLRLGLAVHQGHHHFPGCNCHELPAGQLCSIPIRFSIFLLIYALISVSEQVVHHKGAPWWVIVGISVGGLVLLVLTILVHEFGHGLTVRRLGGQVLYILLWPLGGLCFHTMPQHGPVREKIRRDWWVAFNGPCTHIFMTPVWIAVTALLFRAFGIGYSWSDVGRDLNPFLSAGSVARHHSQAVESGWGVVVVLYLCSTAIHLNVLLFLFNILFPMYPMDSSKLLVTGMQLCGTPVRTAAWRLIYISATCVASLLALTLYQLYRWIADAKHNPNSHGMERMGTGRGMLWLIPLPMLLTMGLGLWGGRQTLDLYKLLQEKSLHKHPLFSHLPRTSRTVRDTNNGRPDTWVEQQLDQYDDPDPPPDRPPAPPDYGAVRIVNGEIVR